MEIKESDLITLVRLVQDLEDHTSIEGNGCGLYVNSAISHLSYCLTKVAGIDKEKAVANGLRIYFEDGDRYVLFSRLVRSNDRREVDHK